METGKENEQDAAKSWVYLFAVQPTCSQPQLKGSCFANSKISTAWRKQKHTQELWLKERLSVVSVLVVSWGILLQNHSPRSLKSVSGSQSTDKWRSREAQSSFSTCMGRCSCWFPSARHCHEWVKSPLVRKNIHWSNATLWPRQSARLPSSSFFVTAHYIRKEIPKSSLPKSWPKPNLFQTSISWDSSKKRISQETFECSHL